LIWTRCCTSTAGDGACHEAAHPVDLAASDRLGLHFELLQQPGAYANTYDRIIESILGLLRGTFRSAEGFEGHAYPGEGANVEVWILGASGGESAPVAGANGLRFEDRVDAQLVGSPSTVADKLEQLQEATGADELAITTITHRHADRVRSDEFLAGEWQRRHG
jgi:alkanesulfonate monooxygenase SsuD/methylene tetrahydromethanopterin reductase-like flavin-dependent oxidoreductase (luciferase family)